MTHPAPAHQWITLTFIVVATAIVIGFDVWATWRLGSSASISQTLCRFFDRWPAAFVAAVFWLGVLVGHLWLPAR